MNTKGSVTVEMEFLLILGQNNNGLCSVAVTTTHQAL